ncbi:MAG: hypothetical protein GWN87_30695 [Desulfuromonadales bacterium]|nr:hypothetical protein [Desulfuromonadales bacterium]
MESGVPIEEISAMHLLRKLKRLGEEIGDDEIERFEEVQREIDDAFDELLEKKS